jgi:hypothetical protein
MHPKENMSLEYEKLNKNKKNQDTNKNSLLPFPIQYFWCNIPSKKKNIDLA